MTETGAECGVFGVRICLGGPQKGLQSVMFHRQPLLAHAPRLSSELSTGRTLVVGGTRRGGGRSQTRSTSVVVGLCSVVIGNGAVVVWFWLHGGGVSLAAESIGGLLTSLGRVTALVGTYLVLLQVLMLARIPWLERCVGFDRLTVWHGRNGKIAITLVLLHVPLIVVGYALTLQISIGGEINALYSTYPWIVEATVGAALLAGVVVTSLVIVRRRLRYEAWYFVHLSVYAGILLAFFHQLPNGNEFSAHAIQRGYWYGLYAVTVLLSIGCRVVAPAVHSWRYRLRVVEVRRESPTVVSIYIEGRRLDRLVVHGGQFFLWRFLTPKRWWQAHPFSLSAEPDGRSLRISVKDLGDFSGSLGELRPGVAVVAEGPFGTFTPQLSARDRVALIAGGIGIEPLRAMLDELLRRGQAVTLIHRTGRPSS